MDFVNHAGWGYVMALGIESIAGFKSVEFEIAMATSGALPDAFIPLGLKKIKRIWFSKEFPFVHASYVINYKWRNWSHRTWWLKWMPAYWLHCFMDKFIHHKGKVFWWVANIISWVLLIGVWSIL